MSHSGLGFVTRVFVALFLSSVYKVAESNVRQRRFHREVNPSNGPRRLSPVWNTTSRTACGHKCISQHGSRCRNFLYNSATGRCTPGSAVVASQPPPNSTEGELYRGAFTCDVSKGFSLKTNNNIKACLAVFKSQKKIYHEAEHQCRVLGGFLASVKTKKKLDILKQVVYGDDNTWVGCDDRVSEGHFVWQEDGELLTSTTTNAVFDDSKDLSTGGEDCVAFDENHLKVLKCDKQLDYVCEMPLA